MEIGSSKESNDIKNICSKTINSNKSENLVKIVTTTKDIPDNFIDNLDVPPLT